jgi:site-specific DNA-cytosine methylase
MDGSLPASAIGAPQERDRVWIVARADDAGFGPFAEHGETAASSELDASRDASDAAREQVGLPDSHGDTSAWRQLLPTPKASDADKGGRGDLLTVLRGYETKHAGTLPTPTARDWRSGKASPETHGKNSRPLNETVSAMGGNRSGRMMGLPTNWTSLED